MDRKCRILVIFVCLFTAVSVLGWKRKEDTKPVRTAILRDNNGNIQHRYVDGRDVTKEIERKEEAFRKEIEEYLNTTEELEIDFYHYQDRENVVVAAFQYEGKQYKLTKKGGVISGWE